MARFSTNKLRSWQIDARSQISKALHAKKNVVVPVNACVGSGKTAGVGVESFFQFIRANKDDKTFQMFVCPRIVLCSQQKEEIEKYFIGSKFESEVQVKIVNCENYDFNKALGEITGKHIIFVICDKSLWGTDKNAKDPEYRFHVWMKTFSNWMADGRKFGSVVYDESHNYNNNQMYMFGNEYFRDGTKKNTTDEPSFMNFFKLSIPMSGTPEDYQIGLTNIYKKFECKCSLKTAINEHMVNIPVLNLILGTRDFWPRAVEEVFKRELLNSNKVKNGLVCVSSIDEIKSIQENFSDSFKKSIHIIALHSDKVVVDKNENYSEIHSMIDGVETPIKLVRQMIERIDSGMAFEDDKPIIVFQVGMLAEGINIRSFSWVITTSVQQIKSMQQVGRVLRLYPNKSSANVYTFYENEKNISKLMDMLIRDELDLVDIQWGVQMDISYGSGSETDPNRCPNMKLFTWNNVDKLIIKSAQNYMNKQSRKRYHQNIKLSDNFDSNIEIIYNNLSKNDDLHKDIDCYMNNVDTSARSESKSVEIYFGLLNRIAYIMNDAKDFNNSKNSVYESFKKIIEENDVNKMTVFMSYCFNGNNDFAKVFAEECQKNKRFHEGILDYFDIM